MAKLGQGSATELAWGVGLGTTQGGLALHAEGTTSAGLSRAGLGLLETDPASVDFGVCRTVLRP